MEAWERWELASGEKTRNAWIVRALDDAAARDLAVAARVADAGAVRDRLRAAMSGESPRCVHGRLVRDCLDPVCKGVL